MAQVFEQQRVRLAGDQPLGYQFLLKVVAEVMEHAGKGFRLQNIELVFERPVPLARGDAPKSLPASEGE